jgi:nitroreductase
MSSESGDSSDSRGPDVPGRSGQPVYAFEPLDFDRLDEDAMRTRAREYYRRADQRRSVRAFSPDPIPLDVVRDAIRSAGTAPSGAHMQPWRFVLVTDPEIKSKIRAAAEQEERETYANRMSEEWRAALAPLGTDENKPFLEIAPALIVVFRVDYGLKDDGSRIKHYYVQESVGIATGMLIAALNAAGLATLTHTPSPMGFLARVLDRPANEKAYLLMPIGYPAEGCEVPALQRKPLDEILVER